MAALKKIGAKLRFPLTTGQNGRGSGYSEATRCIRAGCEEWLVIIPSLFAVLSVGQDIARRKILLVVVVLLGLMSLKIPFGC